MTDTECNQRYFTYVTRGDKNCGCTKSEGTLASNTLQIRADDRADLFEVPAIGKRVGQGVWCGYHDVLADTNRNEPGVTVVQCAERCVANQWCKFYAHGVAVQKGANR